MSAGTIGHHQRTALLQLPRDFSGLERERQVVEQILAANLPVRDPDFAWQGGHRPAVAMFTPHAPPPSVLLLDQVKLVIRNAAGPLFHGPGTRQPRRHPRHAVREPAHRRQRFLAVGEANLNSLFISQGIRRGEHYTVIDPKGDSLAHFDGVPGFTMANDPDNPGEMAYLILAFAAHMHEARRANDKSQWHTLLIEEVNEFSNLMAEWWDGHGPAKANPVVKAVTSILRIG